MSSPRAAWLKDAGAVALVKIAASCAALWAGFRAVSDDDFARVAIAERWAHAPKLDPSGTSWLPLPFWLNGSAMLLFGRSLTTARALAFALGVASAVLVYQAARWLTRDRRAALLGAAIAAAFPWSARLGVATVPELPTAALALIALATLVHDAPAKWRVWGGAALLAATLSRYEAWFLAAGFAALSLWDAGRRRGERAKLLGGAALAVIGPVLWVIWNHAAHGDALHFVARVTAYHRALGANGRLDAGLGYSMALVRAEPELFIFSIASVASLAWIRDARHDIFSRYARPAALSACMLAALMISAAREGAPTHHSERALLEIMLLSAIFAAHAATRLSLSRRGWIAVGAGACTAAIVGAALRTRPAVEAVSVDRSSEMEAGEAAARLLAPGERVLVEIADYGYWAVIAGFARPEDAVVDRELDPRVGDEPSSFGDIETLRARLGTAEAHAFVAKRSAIALEIGEEREAGKNGGVWGVFAAKYARATEM